MKRKYPYLVYVMIAVLSLFVFYLNYQMRHLRNIRDSYKESLNTLNKEIINKQTTIEEQMVNFYNFEGFKIGKTLRFMNQKGDSINLDHILGQVKPYPF